MHDADGSELSRRALLHRGAGIAGLALVASGCRKHGSAPAADPDAAAVAAAVDAEVRLIQMYDAALAAGKTAAAWLTAGRAAHQAHLSALTTRPQLVASPSVPGTPATTLQGDLAAAEQSSAVMLRASAVAAHDGSRAALLASIAAAHVAHASLHPVEASAR